MLATKAQELLGTAYDNNLVMAYRSKAHHITDDITPCTGTGRQHYGIIDTFFYLMDKFGLCIRFDLTIFRKILFRKRNELEEDAGVQLQLYTRNPRSGLEAKGTLRSHIGFDIGNRLAHQAFQRLTVWFKSHTTVNIYGQVRPHFMNIVQFIFFHNLLQHNQRPGRNTTKRTYIPFRSTFYDQFDALFPVRTFRDFLSRLV
ncbi:hypothetical protein D3C86_1308000 [compost metagenome]